MLSKDLEKLGDSVEARLRSLKTPYFTIIILFITVFRSGLRSSDNLQVFVNTLTDWKSSFEHYQTSILMYIIGDVLQISSTREHLLVYGSLLLLFIGLALLLSKTEDLNLSKLLVALILLSPIATVAFTEIGRYDIFVIIGSLVLGASGSLFTTFVGTLLISLGNFEQGLVVIPLTLLVASIYESKTMVIKRLLISMASITIGFYLISEKYGSNFLTQNKSRGSWLQEHFFESLRQNLTSGSFLILSFYGLIWPIIAWIIFKEKNLIKRSKLVVGLILVPSFFSFGTYDGTRVFVCVSAASLVLVITKTIREIEKLPRFTFTCLLLMSLLTPAMNVQVGGQVRTPFHELSIRLAEN